MECTGITNGISIDDSMRAALLEWVRRFSNRNIEWPDVMDGVLLNEIMNLINPDQEAKQTDGNSEAHEAWSRLVNSILNFYQDSLQYLVFVDPPAIQPILDNPNSDEASRQAVSIVLMLLGCAVQCDHKKRFVDQVRTIDEVHHQAIVRCIKEITDRPDNFVHVSQISSDKFSVLSKNLRKFIRARQDLTTRVLDLTQEVNALRSERRRDDDDDQKDNGRKSSRDEAKTLLATQTSRLKELQNLLDEKSEVLREAQEELERSKEKILSLEQQEANNSRMYREEIEVLNEKVSKFTHMEKKCAKLQKKLADLDFWKQHASYLGLENEKMCQAKEQLEREVDTLRKKCADLESFEEEVVRYGREIQEIAEAREKDADLITDLSNEKTQLELEIINLQAAMADRSQTSGSFEFPENRKMVPFTRHEKSNFDESARETSETAKLDESFASLYELDTHHTGQSRRESRIETARLIDIDGSHVDASTQTKQLESDSEGSDHGHPGGNRRSWRTSDGERQINDTVENLFAEIQKLKDFVKLKDASIFLMKLKVDEKTQECQRLAEEVEECKKNHQLEIDRLRERISSELCVPEATKSENESLRSRLASAQVKIEGMKKERERIQQELNNFNDRVTQLIIENNRLIAQHEASVAVCGKVEDENVKLLDQLRDTLDKNQDLLIMILTSREHHAEEQKNYIEQLTELKYGKEKLEERILEQLRKKEKGPLGIGTLVKKMKSKNKPSKSEQFLMSLESPGRSSAEPSLDQSSFEETPESKFQRKRANERRMAKNEDPHRDPTQAGTPSLSPLGKAPRRKDSRPSFSELLRNNLASNKRLYRSELNVSSSQARPDGNERNSSAVWSETQTAVHDDDKTNFQCNADNMIDSKGQFCDGRAMGKNEEAQETQGRTDLTKVRKIESLEADPQVDTNDVNTAKGQHEFSANVCASKVDGSETTCDIKDVCKDEETIKNIDDSLELNRSKKSEDLRVEDVKSSCKNDDGVGVGKDESEVEKVDIGFRFARDSRSTSVPDASGLSENFSSDRLERDSKKEDRPLKTFRALSEWNIHSLKASPGTRFKSSVQSAFTAAGRKIAREMSHLRRKVTSKDANKTKAWKDLPVTNDKQVKYQTLTSDWKHQPGPPENSGVEADSASQKLPKLTFHNLSERRPARVDDRESDPKKEVTFDDNVQQIKDSIPAKPMRKKKAPTPPRADDTGSQEKKSTSSSSSSSEEETKVPVANLSEMTKVEKLPSLSSSSSSSSSPKLPYRESKVCI